MQSSFKMVIVIWPGVQGWAVKDRNLSLRTTANTFAKSQLSHHTSYRRKGRENFAEDAICDSSSSLFWGRSEHSWCLFYTVVMARFRNKNFTSYSYHVIEVGDLVCLLPCVPDVPMSIFSLNSSIHSHIILRCHLPMWVSLDLFSTWSFISLKVCFNDSSPNLFTVLSPENRYSWKRDYTCLIEFIHRKEMITW